MLLPKGVATNAIITSLPSNPIDTKALHPRDTTTEEVLVQGYVGCYL
jgi:hypothetical protein